MHVPQHATRSPEERRCSFFKLPGKLTAARSSVLQVNTTRAHTHSHPAHRSSSSAFPPPSPGSAVYLLPPLSKMSQSLSTSSAVRGRYLGDPCSKRSLRRASTDAPETIIRGAAPFSAESSTPLSQQSATQMLRGRRHPHLVGNYQQDCSNKLKHLGLSLGLLLQ